MPTRNDRFSARRPANFPGKLRNAKSETGHFAPTRIHWSCAVVVVEEENLTRRRVDQFILNEIESVPHLEMLLLLWNSKPRQWSQEELSKSLYIPLESVRRIAQDLEYRRLLTISAEGYAYNSGYSRDVLMESVDQTYRQELIRISSMIHWKRPPLSA